jgi:hypothetical protein
MELHARAHTEHMRQASTSQLQTIQAPPAHANLRARGYYKTPGALLRMTFTSTPRVNRTNVETLRRPSFDVRLPAHLLPSLSSERTCQGQSFAQIARSHATQLALLPGYRLKKVGRRAEGRVRAVHPHGHGGRRALRRRSSEPRSILRSTRHSSPCFPQPLRPPPPAAARDFMCALTQVPRFRTVARFLSASERGAARAVWVWGAVVLGADDVEDADVAEAARAWGIDTQLCVVGQTW